LKTFSTTTSARRVDTYDDYLYVVLHRYEVSTEPLDVVQDQISLVIGADYLISFQERPTGIFEPVRQRLRSDRGNLRGAAPDMLAYSLMDALVDSYFAVIEQLDDYAEDLEADILEGASREVPEKIHQFKRCVSRLRRNVYPLRELLGSLHREHAHFFGPEIQVYLRDVYDHTVHIVESLDDLRELATGLLDIHLTTVSNRVNLEVRTLTVVATVFMPASLLAGIFGMNFQVMPWLEQPRRLLLRHGPDAGHRRHHARPVLAPALGRLPAIQPDRESLGVEFEVGFPDLQRAPFGQRAAVRAQLGQQVTGQFVLQRAMALLARSRHALGHRDDGVEAPVEVGAQRRHIAHPAVVGQIDRLGSERQQAVDRGMHGRRLELGRRGRRKDEGAPRDIVLAIRQPEQVAAEDPAGPAIDDADVVPGVTRGVEAQQFATGERDDVAVRRRDDSLGGNRDDLAIDPPDVLLAIDGGDPGHQAGRLGHVADARADGRRGGRRERPPSCCLPRRRGRGGYGSG
jgi:magnesium/cobalt transport protein CorA